MHCGCSDGRVDADHHWPRSHSTHDVHTAGFEYRPGTASTAKAFCLDYAEDIPSERRAFKYAPSASSDAVSVNIGGHTYPLQEALDKGYISVSGTGGFTSLAIENHTDKPVSFVVNKNSVVAPDQSYQTQDAQLTAERLNGQQVSQRDLWHQRAVEQAQALGIPAQDVIGTDVLVKMPGHAETFAVDIPHMLKYEQVVGRAMRSRPPAGLLVQRVKPVEPPGKPLFLLYEGRGRPRPFVGNGDLGDLGSEAKDAWSSAGGAPPPRITFVGDGDLQDFDAASLMLALKSRESLSSQAKNSSQARTEVFSFDTPNAFAELEAFPNFREIIDPPVIQRSSGLWKISQSFKGAYAYVTGRTREAVSVVLASIRSTFVILHVKEVAVSDLNVQQKRDLIQFIKTNAEEELRKAYTNNPTWRAAEGGPVGVRLQIGNQSASVEISLLESPINSPTKFAER